MDLLEEDDAKSLITQGRGVVDRSCGSECKLGRCLETSSELDHRAILESVDRRILSCCIDLGVHDSFLGYSQRRLLGIEGRIDVLQHSHDDVGLVVAEIDRRRL